ncbi:hypothetical protein FRC03_007360 [Tulasnella sp. 419]|nr:hypothetical protein FRC03_007360 [Tulasnella sp. 419]
MIHSFVWRRIEILIRSPFRTALANLRLLLQKPIRVNPSLSTKLNTPLFVVCYLEPKWLLKIFTELRFTYFRDFRTIALPSLLLWLQHVKIAGLS